MTPTTSHLTRRWGVRVAIVVTLGLIPVLAAAEQRPDSTSPGEASGEETNRPNHMMLPLAALVGVLAVAPPAIMFLAIPEKHAPSPTSWRWRAYASGGVIGEGEIESPNYWSHAETVEVRGGHLMAEFRHQRVLLDAPVAYQEAKAGWVFSPGMRVEGGVAAGIRGFSGGNAPTAVVVSVPVRMTDTHGAVVFEPTYVLDGDGIDWEYRFQAEFHGLPRPLFAGAAVEVRSLRPGGANAMNVALLFGVRQ